MTDHPGEFDFWLGMWRGTWEREGGSGSAVNRITKEYGGSVVVERFSADGPEQFNGLSVSVYDQVDSCWKQTWVDDQGSYLDFRGGFDGAAMVLSRQAVADGQAVIQRMVWQDIETDRFRWLWQRSRVGGGWETLWEIRYMRE